MEKWQLINLGDLITHKKGFAFKSSSYVDEGILVVRVSDTTNTSIDVSTCKKVSDDIAIQYKDYELLENDIVIMTVGSWPDNPESVVGKVIKVPLAANNALLNQNAVRIRSRNQINQDFLYFRLKDRTFSGYIVNNAQGSANQASITLDDIFSFKLNLPPLPEQRAIASVLSSLDDKIDLLHRQNRTLEAMAETLFRQWFVEEADEGWEEKPLSSIAKHKKVNVRPDQNPETIYHHYSIPSFDDGKHPIKELGSEIKSNKYQVLANSILISKLNPRFPRVWAVDELLDVNSICSTEFQVVLPDKSEYYAFIYCFLKSKQVTDELIGAAGGTSGSHQRVKPADILNLTFQMSPQQKIDDFNLITSKNLKKITNNMKQIRTLEKLRDTLLPKLMSGEVSVQLAQREAAI